MPRIDKVTLKAFWEAVERRLAACSAEELRAVLRAMAQQTLPTERSTIDRTPEAVEFWVTRAGKGRELGPVHAASPQMEKLSELRNKSAIAHGYEGVSGTQIEQVVAVKELLDAVRRGLTALEVTVTDSPFIQVQDLLREALGGDGR